MNPRVVHFYFPIFGTLFIPIDTRPLMWALTAGWLVFSRWATRVRCPSSATVMKVFR